ncbi:MAG TPA: LLM class flavin-dependent oxidoreductase [Anaerolineales bacterium]|nr:LLM class flavin-dependent oxidoreductase [Anaerolineales bacterium]
MHSGIEVVPFGDFSNPRAILDLALAAEASGWEAIWIWDHMLVPYGAGDPWVTLSAVAACTKSLRLCVGVSPLPRYRPHLLARMLAGLDLLSSGRVIFSTGLGIAPDFAPFGEPAEDKIRAAMLDEGLGLLDGYLSGEEVNLHGKYYTAEKVRMVPSALQKPRIPIWIGGDSRAALRRAAHWNGWIIGTVDEKSQITKTPEQLARQVSYICEHRASSTPFDVAVDGASAPGQAALIGEYEQAGATWWFEIIHQLRGTTVELVRRIQAGPAR